MVLQVLQYHVRWPLKAKTIISNYDDNKNKFNQY